MNPVRSFLKNATAFGLARVFQNGTNLILVVILSRQLGVAGFGVYATALAYYSMGAHWVGPGLSTYIARELARDPARTGAYVVHLGALTGGIALALLAGLAAAAQLLDYSPAARAAIAVALLALLPAAVNTILESALVAHERVEILAWSQLLGNLGDLAGTAALLAGGYGVQAVILNFVCWRYATLLVRACLFGRRIGWPEWRLASSALARLLRELKPFMMLGVVGGVFTVETEVILLSLFADEYAVGVYSAALKILTVWYLVPNSVLSVAFPLLSRSYAESVERFNAMQRRAIRLLMAIAFPLATGLAVFGPRAVRLLYGAGFEEAGVLVVCLAWMPVLLFLEGVLWRTLLARNEQDVACRAQLLSVGIRLAAGCLLIPAFGYAGAAAALAISFLSFVGLHAYYVARGGTPIRFFRVNRGFLGAALGMAGVAAVLEHLVRVPVGLNVAFSMAVYGGLAYAFQAFHQEDALLIRQLVVREG
ncbi:MAG: oligosaccharide flippase family protein [Candidatus Methylomirabilales bacterium]